MAFRLDRIEICGFRSIRRAKLPLGNLNVVVGVNGAGKSNLLDAFDLLRAVATESFREFVGRRGGAHRILYRGAGAARGLGLGATTDQADYVAQIDFAQVDALVFLSEGFTHEGAALHDLDGPFKSVGHSESVLRQYEGPHAEGVQAFASGLGGIRGWHLADTSPTSLMRGMSGINDNRELNPDGSNLASMLYLLSKRHPIHFRLVVSTLQLVAPFIAELVVEPTRQSPQYVHLQWRQRGTDGLFDAGHLSDGTLRFLAIATLLLQPTPPPVILIDEPELGLHPHAVVVLGDLLRRASEQSQLVVATQSRQLVDVVDVEHVVVAERAGNETQFRRLDADVLAKWLDRYSLGELWDMNVLEAVGRVAGA